MLRKVVGWFSLVSCCGVFGGCGCVMVQDTLFEAGTFADTLEAHIVSDPTVISISSLKLTAEECI